MKRLPNGFKPVLGASGPTATQHSKKASEKVLGGVLANGSEKGACYGFYSSEKGSEKGSQKGF